MQLFETAQDAALTLRPDQPVYCFRPQILTEDARNFVSMFPGKTAYAVKTNGEPMVLETLVKAGITATGLYLYWIGAIMQLFPNFGKRSQ